MRSSNPLIIFARELATLGGAESLDLGNCELPWDTKSQHHHIVSVCITTNTIVTHIIIMIIPTVRITHIIIHDEDDDGHHHHDHNHNPHLTLPQNDSPFFRGTSSMAEARSPYTTQYIGEAFHHGSCGWKGML